MFRIDTQTRSILAAMSSHLAGRGGSAAPADRHPFVTISEQAGARGGEFSHALARRLEQVDPGQPPWTVWDKSLVGRVAENHNLSQSLVAGLEDADHSFLSEIFRGFTLTDHAPVSEMAVFRRVAETIRALAQAGRAVIVGRGGVFITQDLPLGIHVRLIGPPEHRAARLSEHENISLAEARRRVKTIDLNREKFFHVYWPGRIVDAETFTVTFNVEKASLTAMTDAVTAIVESLTVRTSDVAQRVVTKV